jgi:hypothetical protein
MCAPGVTLSYSWYSVFRSIVAVFKRLWQAIDATKNLAMI